MSTDTADLQAKALDYVQAVSELGTLITKQAEAGLAHNEKVRPMTKKVADVLLRGKLIQEGEEDAALKLASTHEGALQLVLNLESHLEEVVKQAQAAQTAQQKLGQGVPDGPRTKKASYDSTESPFVGKRAGQGERRASDVAIFTKLGIPFPTEA